jgi:hypothetical protein
MWLVLCTWPINQLVTSRAWTEPRQIEQQLASLTELMDFPANFSEEAARRLVSIAQNGPRCGVYAVIMVDTSKPLPHGFTLADLERASTVIAWDGNRFLWPDQEFKDCLLALDSPPNAVLFNRIVNTVGEAAKDAGKVEVPFDNPAARLLSRPGEAIYNAANGMVEGNNRFQVAWLPDDKRDHYLQRIRTLAKERGYTRLPIIFEGNAPAEVEKNQQLHNLLTRSTPPIPLRAIPAWLGDPIAIREAVAATFRRQSGSNLLVVGQDDEAALGMMSIALISLAAQLPPDKSATFYILNFGRVDGSSADLLPRLAKLFPHTVKIGRRRQLPTIINTLATEVQRRIEAEDALSYAMDQKSVFTALSGAIPSPTSTAPLLPYPVALLPNG